MTLKPPFRRSFSNSFGSETAPITPPVTLATMLGGQSNAKNRFIYGGVEFSSEMDDLVAGDYVYVDGAITGSQMISANGGPNYWWNSDTSTFGPAMTNFENVLSGTDRTVTAVVFDQGESDYITLFKTAYLTGAQNVLEHIDDITGGAPIFITIPHSTSNNGSAWDGSTINSSVQMIREAWWKLIEDNPTFVFEGSERFDLPQSDSQHLTSGGYQTLAVRDARLIAKHLGHTVSGSTLGPRITDVVRSGDTVTVTIAHDGGTDFTPTTGIQGFYFTDNGSSITIDSAVRTNATTITLTLASEPSGTELLYYIYGKNQGVSDLASIVRDNSPQALPLRASKHVVGT